MDSVKRETPIFTISLEDNGKNSTAEESRRQASNKPNLRLGLTPLTTSTSNSSDLNDSADFLNFPIESSHAYSYARLSPNSLALRLNVLKRSLEILRDHPKWFQSIDHEECNNSDDESFSQEYPQGKAPSISKRPASYYETHNIPSSRKHSLYQAPSANNSLDSLMINERPHLQKNGSSAALAALLRSKNSRADMNSLYKVPEGSIDKKQDINTKDHLHELSTLVSLSDDLKDMLELLQNSDSTGLYDNVELFSSFHDLSLSSEDNDIKKKQNVLRSRLLFALATPFVESPAITTSLLTSASTPNPSSGTGWYNGPLSSYPSLVSVNLPQQPSFSPSNPRPFHALSQSKRNAPQSVFTVDESFPWPVKAANDLACLMFGVSKSMIKSLSLMDLIAPQFRDFVTEKLTKGITLTSSHVSNEKKSKHDIIFAGEIIAISRQADHNFAWTSMWAKKRGNLIICMFEQIPCDAFDVVILANVQTYPQTPYNISSAKDIAGKLLYESNNLQSKNLANISSTLKCELDELANDASRGSGSNDFRDSNTLNKSRYFTLQIRDEQNIPCAVTSYPLERDEDKYEIKLKFHSLPYIAGMFVVDFSGYKILSSNNSIANNLFGRSSGEIDNCAVDRIIPKFSAILNLGLEREAIDVVPGLVLPEHFFRKYDAILREASHPGSPVEELFLASRGINGLHRDGKQILVDIQLRVILNNVFVLWVTYSRHTKNISNELTKLTRSGSTKSLSSSPSNSRPRGNSEVLRNDLPSQLKLFPENESEIIELNASSPEVSRANSTRRPTKANTFSIPVTYMPSSPENENGRSPDSERFQGSGNQKEQKGAFEQSSQKLQTVVNKRAVSSKHPGYRIYSEDEMLQLENDALEKKIKSSKFWPTKIGEKKRTKKFSEFKVLKNMGEGAYGKVVLAQFKEDPAYQVIIKCIDKQRILVDTWVRDRQLGTIPSEIQVMATLNHEPHPNVMRIIDYFEDPSYYYLETPIFGNPPAIDLFDYIEVKKDMSERECQFIFKQVVNSIYHLHKHGIVHRDIKDENVIVDERGIVKLIDFGSAGYVRLGPFDVFVGTIDYASPEVLRGDKYEGKPQDVWALGILLYTMIYKENPFYNVDEIMEGDLRVPYVVSEESLALIRRILVRELNERPTITDIVEDDWIDI